MIVVDSNVIAYCWIHGERTALAHRLRRLDSDWHAPVLWRSELRNILTGYRRDGSLDEVPVRRILLGHPVEKAANVGAMRNPQALDYFVQFAKRLSGG